MCANFLKYFLGKLIKVVLNSYLILKKMNERITEVNISTNIHNERIKTQYILRTFLKLKVKYLKS